MRVIPMETIQEIETDMLFKACDLCEQFDIEYYLIAGSALGTIRHSGPIPWDDDADIGIPYYETERFFHLASVFLDKKYYVDDCRYNSKSPSLHPKICAYGFDDHSVHIDVFPYIGMPADKEEAKAHFESTFKYNEMLRIRRFAYQGVKSNQTLIMRYYRMRHLIKQILLYPTTKTSKNIIKEFDECCLKYDYNKAEYVMYPCGGYGMKNYIPKKWLGSGCRREYNGKMIKVPQEYDKYLKRIYGDYMKLPEEDKRNVKVFSYVDEEVIKLYWSNDEIKNMRIQDKSR